MLCRVCDHNQFFLAVDLGVQPSANLFLTEDQKGKELSYPLKVIVCEKCKTAQLDYTIKKEVIYEDHTYLSGITRSLAEHFENTARSVDQRFFQSNSSKSVLDIGSNDGTQLKAYQKLGYQVLGVESAKTIAQIAQKANVPTLHAFFNLETADKIGQTFDVINASGVFFHLEELHSVTEAIKKYLKPNGVFVVQFLYMKSIMENGAFDQIYHEHLLYYTLKTVEVLLNRHGLSLFDAEFSSIHGGSIIGYVSHAESRPRTERLLKLQAEEDASLSNEFSTYRTFSKNIVETKKRNLDFISKKLEEGKKIFGMGAPVKGNTLLNFFGITPKMIPYLVEKNPLRKGLFSPGMHIPIRLEEETSPPDVYYVLAWNFKKEILQNNQHLLMKGVEFYFPIEPKR